ncbi:G protein-coupled receptor, rhodopsin-like family and GPCR, rhodopsin-like, 7TM domain-containing protein [Strongyloides ratti]|uniref:G protein-coupled receptor, rhodopsin-like family and GPCR, rhodopsin-like, 7TM domain-containing protein n=1 Tax=Strongyloides ratti TaxID=34506 RepID=A0A090L9E6_STRRB|nr:G protein-coupled receptor, rhodopsin-like family and GPCR, rhodopsin-like, 7TM domain-containing protein [Strongyloides ratti]CEF64733.1 G protein-coupled receptor, rhodopsin-like family and GPCR, rhodopsin-like, 7TM domain-containing protein [Strongyloides ratti]
MADYFTDENIRNILNDSSPFQKESLLTALMQKEEIFEVLPPPNHEDSHVLTMAICYMLLFLIGICGNVAVMTTIYHVVRSQKTTIDNTLIYVIVLSCVDFGVCMSLPFTVIDQILGFWMFGSVLCKLHAVLENFGKILSSLILTAMSFDRYAGVCHPHRKYLRSKKLAISILVGLAIYALVTLCPLLLNFSARELILFEKETAPYKITRMRIEKCTMSNMSSFSFSTFTIYQCVLCYIIPLILVVYFYTRLLTRLRHHARQFKSSQIPLLRISVYTMMVSLFYFLCWTPFWIATTLAVYLEYVEEGQGSSAVPHFFVYAMYFIHALPFTNSAVNWILYGALNSQLQLKQRSSGNFRSEITNNCLQSFNNTINQSGVNKSNAVVSNNDTSINNNSKITYKFSAPLSSGKESICNSKSSATEMTTLLPNGLHKQSLPVTNKPFKKVSSETFILQPKEDEDDKSKDNIILIGYDCDSEGTYL